jgi:transketolase
MPTAITGQGLRRHILHQSKRANVGHIGSALSVADILAALYGGVLRGEPDDPDRDRFVMSKGHAALALYAALHMAGHLSQDVLDTFSRDETLLGVHPHHGLAGVDFSTGSLGQGLAMGAGAALAAKLQGSRRRVFVLLSDAECNEGSVWEAAMFAAHHQLGNLVAIVDLNRQQALGYTKDVIALEPLEDRWRAFGWDVHSVDGHDQEALAGTMAGLSAGPPHVLVAHTTFGKGVSFMESQIRWHYMPMDDQQYVAALAEIGD